METFNKTISNFENKPYEILQDNIELLQNELRSKDEIIKSTFKQTTTTNRKQHHFMILRRKMSTNQIKISSSKDKRIRSITTIKLTLIKNLNKERDFILAILTRVLKSKTLSSFLASMQPHTYRKIVVFTCRLGKMAKIKGLGLQ